MLYNETKTNIVHRLKGNYGFKRFGRDGYKTVLEDKQRRYYRPGEIKVSKFMLIILRTITEELICTNFFDFNQVTHVFLTGL
jgi:hypothetical protein